MNVLGTRYRARKQAPLEFGKDLLSNDLDRESLGSQLRAARTDNRISLRELARRVGISASFLSQVELGKTTPSIGTLYSIVSELDISLDGLMQDKENNSGSSLGTLSPSLQVETVGSHDVGVDRLPGFQGSHDRAAIDVEGVMWERLTPKDDPLTEFLKVTYKPGSESCPSGELMRHGGWEYIHMLSGHLDVQVGFKRQVLSAGDSLNFDSTSPHRLANSTSEDCVAIWMVVGRHGFAHPMDLARSGTEHLGTGVPY